MAKNWWFKFDMRAWQSDSDLRRCSPEARCVWLELLLVMYEKETFKVSGSYEELGQLASCTPSVIARAVVELKAKDVANVTLGNGTVTLVSRRLKRELTIKEQTRLRVRRHRGNGDVTDISKEKEVKSKEKEEEKREEAASPPPNLEVSDELVIASIESAFKIRLDLDNRKLATRAVSKEHAHLFPAFVQGRAMGWADKPDGTKLRQIGYVLTDFQKDNKVNTNGAITKYPNKRTDADVLAESAEFYDNYPA